MADLLAELADSVVRLAGDIATIAAMSPLQGVLLVVGALVMAVSILVFGYLAVGAAFAPLGIQFPSPGRGPSE